MLAAGDDVDVHLAHLIADAADIELGGGKCLLDPLRDAVDQSGDFSVKFGVELMEVFDIGGDLWHDQEPREKCVIFQPDLAAIDSGEVVGARGEALIELKCHGGQRSQEAGKCKSGARKTLRADGDVAMQSGMAGLIIVPRARIFHGHDWVYASDVKKAFGNPQPGDVVSLKDFRDRPLGSAIYNPQSQIVARRFSRRGQDLDEDFFTRRIEQALAFRKMRGVDERLCRVVWSESDGIPGVVIDRYDDVVVLQTLTLGMDMRLEPLVAAIRAVLEPKCVILRNDSPIRRAEGLELSISMARGEAPGAFPVQVNGLTYEIDPYDGQKTGLYLDQLDAHAEVAAMAAGKRVLDVFCNQGGFALAAAKAGAQKVTAVDISAPAADAARKNAELNGVEIDVITENAFDFLKKAKPDYDLIVLDPPSFTKNKKTLNDAMRGYKEIHLRALKLLPKGGLLSTFCCSHHASRELFLQNLVSASVDAKKTIRLVAEHGQRADHPILPAIPETGYLKGFTVEVIPSR